MATIIGIIIVALLALGVWVWMMNDKEDETVNQETNSDMVTESTENTGEAESTDIVATAMETESLSTLVTAVQAAGLVETLQGEGPFTVFAPTNAAFEKLPEGTLNDLLLPENKEQLASLLQYHAVAGAVKSSDLQNGQVITTLNGGTLTVEMMDGMVYLVDATGGRAQVITPDVMTSNGVVHLIDTVVMPQ